jgi:hypothetical protein
MQAEITLAPEEGSLLAIGLSAERRTVRAVLNLRTGDSWVKAAETAADGVSFTTCDCPGAALRGTQPVALTLTLGDDGQVGIAVDGTALAFARVPRLPAGQPATLVLQTFQTSGQSAAVLTRLVLRGRPPAR